MRIKVKIKTLMVAAAGFLVLGLLLIRFGIPQLELYAAQKQLAEGKEEAKQKILASLKDVSESQKWELIKEHFIEEEIYNRFNVYIGPDSSFWSDGREANQFTWDEKLPYLNEYIARAPVDGYFAEAVKQLVYFHQREGDEDEAIAVMEKGIDRFGDYADIQNRQDLEIERVDLLIEQGKRSQAFSEFKKLNAKKAEFTGDQSGQLALLEARLMLEDGKVSEAKQLVAAKVSEEKIQWEKEAEETGGEDMGEPVILSELETFLDSLDGFDEGNNMLASVEGRLMKSDGTPVSNAGVILRRESDVYSSVSPEEPFQTITDKEGNFSINGVIPGHYQVFLGLSFEQIDGWAYPAPEGKWLTIEAGEAKSMEIVLKPLIELSSPVNQEVVKEQEVVFEWGKVPGAAYYDLELGFEVDSGSMGVSFEVGITGNKLEVPVDEIYDIQGGIVFSEENEEADPVSILAFANSENRFLWSVKAYDSSGNMLTQSNGYRLDEKTIGNLPFFYLKERELTEADRLYLDGQKERAYEQYEESYRGNPEDLHSLRMLARLPSSEWNESEDQPDDYQRKWAEVSSSAYAAFSMAKYYGQERDWKQYQYWYDEYIKRTGKPHHYDLGFNGQKLMEQGLPEQAIVHLRKSVDQDPDHRFIGSLLAAVLSEGAAFEEAISLADQYPDFMDMSRETDWLGMIQDMKTESASVPGYRGELKNALSLAYSGRESEWKEWAGKTKLSALRVFVEAAARVE